MDIGRSELSDISIMCKLQGVGLMSINICCSKMLI